MTKKTVLPYYNAVQSGKDFPFQSDIRLPFSGYVTKLAVLMEVVLSCEVASISNQTIRFHVPEGIKFHDSKIPPFPSLVLRFFLLIFLLFCLILTNMRLSA